MNIVTLKNRINRVLEARPAQGDTRAQLENRMRGFGMDVEEAWAFADTNPSIIDMCARVARQYDASPSEVMEAYMESQ